MLKVAIVDDDNVSLDFSSSTISKFFKEKNLECKVSSFTNPLNYLATEKEEPFDIVFLDIDMPERQGLDVARDTLSINKNTNIIFLSQREDLVFECLAFHPFGFIRKSNLINDFSLILDQFYTMNLKDNLNTDKLEFHEKNKTLSFKINEIVYVSSNRNYQDIVTKDKKIESIRIPLSVLEEKLLEKGFIRVHKCYLVNHLYIRSILNEEIRLTIDETIPISKKRKDEIMRLYLSYSRNSNSIIL